MIQTLGHHRMYNQFVFEGFYVDELRITIENPKLVSKSKMVTYVLVQMQNGLNHIRLDKIYDWAKHCEYVWSWPGDALLVGKHHLKNPIRGLSIRSDIIATCPGFRHDNKSETALVNVIHRRNCRLERLPLIVCEEENCWALFVERNKRE